MGRRSCTASQPLGRITIDDRAYEVEKASRSFIKERVVPGGSLPSLAAITHDLAQHTDLQLIHLQDLTANYVPTQRHWRERFLAHAGELAALGYDEAFQRPGPSTSPTAKPDSPSGASATFSSSRPSRPAAWAGRPIRRDP